MFTKFFKENGKLQVLLLAIAIIFVGQIQDISQKQKDSGSAASSQQEQQEEDSTFARVLVNDENPLPSDFTVPLRTFLESEMDYRIIPSLEQLLIDAKTDGISLKIFSGYRNIKIQTILHKEKLDEYIAQGYSETQAQEKTAMEVPPAGYSEHHTGLAVDFMLDETPEDVFEDTAAFVWLEQHAADYGFILRYPKDKETSTHMNFKPNHYRYVGKQVATEIKDSGKSLEEYLKM